MTCFDLSWPAFDLCCAVIAELIPEDFKVIAQHRKELDRHLLAGISRSVQSKRAARALDLTTCLLMPSSVELAIKLAAKAKVTLSKEDKTIPSAVEMPDKD